MRYLLYILLFFHSFLSLAQPKPPALFAELTQYKSTSDFLRYSPQDKASVSDLAKIQSFLKQTKTPTKPCFQSFWNFIRMEVEAVYGYIKCQGVYLVLLRSSYAKGPVLGKSLVLLMLDQNYTMLDAFEISRMASHTGQWEVRLSLVKVEQQGSEMHFLVKEEHLTLNEPGEYKNGKYMLNANGQMRFAFY